MFDSISLVRGKSAERKLEGKNTKENHLSEKVSVKSWNKIVIRNHVNFGPIVACSPDWD